MKTLSDIDVSGKRVFLRADLDVPLKSTNVEQVTRLTNLRPTVDWLFDHGASKIIIAGHIDRPQKPDPAFSTEQIKERLEAILSRSVIFTDNFDREILEDLVLLENLRFWPGEMANDLEFAKELASLADIYINEAFGNSHRNHASMVALPALFPDVEDLIESEDSSESERPEGPRPRRAAGLHLEEEVKALSGLLEAPKRPFLAIVGGAKIETKEPLIEHLAKIADYVLVAGELVKEIANNNQFSTSDKLKIVVAALTSDGRDISQESISKFKTIISGAKTIAWNGPMGVFEEGFGAGTLAIAEAILASGAYTVVGGGETTQFLAAKNLLSHFSFVSSGGGAMLAFLAGKTLPGLAALE